MSVESEATERLASLYQLSTKLASVIGLAPIRDGLKTRLLELLCIHGRK